MSVPVLKQPHQPRAYSCFNILFRHPSLLSPFLSSPFFLISPSHVLCPFHTFLAIPSFQSIQLYMQSGESRAVTKTNAIIVLASISLRVLGTDPQTPCQNFWGVQTQNFLCRKLCTVDYINPYSCCQLRFQKTQQWVNFQTGFPRTRTT